MTWKIVNISNPGTSIKFGADDTDKISRLFSATDVDDVDINADWKFRSGKLQISNIDNSFKYTITGDAIAGNRTLKLPLTTGTDALPALGIENIFTDTQTIFDNQSDLLKVYRDSSTTNDSWGILWQAKDSGGNATTYGRIRSTIIDSTDTTEDGQLRFSIMKAGTLVECARIDEVGKFYCGGSNRRIIFDETGLSAARTYTFPNINTALAGAAVDNNFTEGQTITDSSSIVLDLQRDASSVGDGIALTLKAKDSGGNYTTYGQIRGEIDDSTDTSEDGHIEVNVMKAGTSTQVFTFRNDGDIEFGANLRAILSESGLTAQRTIKFPNVNTTLSGVVDQSGATVDTHTTNTEFDILNYSVPANALGSNGSVRFTITGYILQNDVTGTTYTFRVKFGTTTMYQDVTASLAQSPDKRAVRITGELFNKNATNAQGCSAYFDISDTAGATTGIGDISDDEHFVSSAVDSETADTTKDTTSAQTLQVTCQMSVSSASTHFVTKHTIVEVLP